MKNIKLIGLAFSALTILTAPVLAQGYPDRTITLIVPQTPGGATDTMSRIFATAMSKELGQEIVVENRPGAGNTIGMTAVAESDPDGYTLGVGTQSSLSIAPLRRSDLAYDPIDSFMPIYNFANIPNALLVWTGLGPKSLDELVAYANDNPGELNYASGGTGSTSHFATAQFAAMADIEDKAVHIPYQGGGKAAGGLASGEAHFLVGPFSSSAMFGQIQAGNLIAVAVAGDKRVEKLPGTPTFAEAGLPTYDNIGFYGMVAPAGTPPEVIARLNEAGNAAAKSPEVIEALGNMGIEPVQVTPEEFADQIQANLDSFTKLVDEGAVKLE